jgi:hypothetical protein
MRAYSWSRVAAARTHSKDGQEAGHDRVKKSGLDIVAASLVRHRRIKLNS